MVRSCLGVVSEMVYRKFDKIQGKTGEKLNTKRK